MSHHYAFTVPGAKLPKFLDKVNECDDMGGNDVKHVTDLKDGRFVVVISRQFAYPCIINHLKDLEAELNA